MKKFNKKAVSIMAPSVLVLGLVACSDERAEYSDVAAPEQSKTEQTMQTPAGLYGTGRGEQDQALAATVHRTITFSGESTELDEIAEQSLERMTESLNDDLSTQVTVRTVDANDVTQSDASRLNEERVKTVKNFLEGKGVNVADIRIDRYDAREFVETQDGTPYDQETMQTESAEIGGSREDPQQVGQARQDVVITIVSSASQ